MCPVRNQKLAAVSRMPYIKIKKIKATAPSTLVKFRLKGLLAMADASVVRAELPLDDTNTQGQYISTASHRPPPKDRASIVSV